MTPKEFFRCDDGKHTAIFYLSAYTHNPNRLAIIVYSAAGEPLAKVTTNPTDPEGGKLEDVWEFAVAKYKDMQYINLLEQAEIAENTKVRLRAGFSELLVYKLQVDKLSQEVIDAWKNWVEKGEDWTNSPF